MIPVVGPSSKFVMPEFAELFLQKLAMRTCFGFSLVIISTLVIIPTVHAAEILNWQQADIDLTVRGNIQLSNGSSIPASELSISDRPVLTDVGPRVLLMLETFFLRTGIDVKNNAESISILRYGAIGDLTTNENLLIQYRLLLGENRRLKVIEKMLAIIPFASPNQILMNNFTLDKESLQSLLETVNNATVDESNRKTSVFWWGDPKDFVAPFTWNQVVKHEVVNFVNSHPSTKSNIVTILSAYFVFVYHLKV